MTDFTPDQVTSKVRVCCFNEAMWTNTVIWTDQLPFKAFPNKKPCAENMRMLALRLIIIRVICREPFESFFWNVLKSMKNQIQRLQSLGKLYAKACFDFFIMYQDTNINSYF